MLTLWLLQCMFTPRKVVPWQPITACVCCHEEIEQRAIFCATCGTPQHQPQQVAQQQRETEELQQLRRLHETDKLATETTECLYSLGREPVRISQIRPMYQYVAETQRIKARGGMRCGDFVLAPLVDGEGEFRCGPLVEECGNGLITLQGRGVLYSCYRDGAKVVPSNTLQARRQKRGTNGTQPGA